MQKKSLKVTVAAALLAVLAVPALAQYSGPGAQPVAMSVQAVLATAVDDQMVTLRGKLVRQIKHEHYVFSDGKGEIVVEIDDKLFMGRPVGADATVEIIGEVDKELYKTEIDVKALRVVQ